MMMRLWYVLLLSAVAGQGTSQSVTGSMCGSDTLLDMSTNQCVCKPMECVPNVTEDQFNGTGKIYLAGIFDLDSFDWGPDIFEYTVKLINEGHWNIPLQPGVDQWQLVYSLKNEACDETTAVRGYWDLRTQNGNKPMDGIIGCRCSGPSISLARISGLEKVPQISPSSNSAKLTDDTNEFPYFSRMVAPNNEEGEGGALVALLRAFDWERVAIIGTDTVYAKDFITEFQNAWVGSHGDWVGSISYSATIRLIENKYVDPDSVAQALRNVPSDDSRIIVLVAHVEHAFDIIQAAEKRKLEPDTVWVGPSGWVGRDPPTPFSLQPGYLGVAPFFNCNSHYSSYITGLQAWQRNQRKSVSMELPVFAAEIVDSIVAMTMAIALTKDRRDGAAVVRNLRQLDFEGVSGRVQFTPEGDRRNPKYSIFNAQSIGSNGTVLWKDVGVSGSGFGSAALKSDNQEICFPKKGCIFSEWPDDTYKVRRLPIWIILLVLAFGLLFVAVSIKHWLSRRKLRRIKAELEAFRSSIVGMRAVSRHCIPRLVRKNKNEEGDIEQALSGKVAVAPMEYATWCWKETSTSMGTHNASDIQGDPAECWIKYSTECNSKLEAAFKEGKPQCSPLSEYIVNFRSMKQTKVATGYEREIRRFLVTIEAKNENGVQKEIDLAGVHVRDGLPVELRAEPQMVLVEGDIVQISTQRQDGWAFGTKLHHADEAIARQLVALTVAFSTGDPDGAEEVAVDSTDESNVFADTGWFHMDSTRMPSSAELIDCMKNVGDVGALDPPSHWDAIVDPTVAQRHELQQGNDERDAVVKAFMATLNRPGGKVLKVERIQNLAMWQSYVVKRQTICYRETGNIASSSDDEKDNIQRKALERFERRWLWHGSNKDVMDKILQQGFNRSFCGKNATAYGKGVYFARDTSYSTDKTYAVPDSKGNQYIMACRVVVGEYCCGRHDALTPDVRHAASQSLYDTTVGVLTGDTMANPSIYVTYHDAQAYPEYMITFKAS